MFEPNSRYAQTPTVDAKSATGKTAKVVKLRRIPSTPGNLTEVKGTDRLDIMAHRKYSDGTKFWHIADANSELEANSLVANETPENPVQPQKVEFIDVPES